MIEKVLQKLISENNLKGKTLLLDDGLESERLIKCICPSRVFKFPHELDSMNQEEKFIFYKKNEETLFIDRTKMSRFGSQQYFDLYFEYINYLIENVLYVDKKTIYKNVKREFVKKFFDENNVKKIIIPNLNDEVGMFYKSFACDLNCEIMLADNSENISMLLEYDNQLINYNMGVRQLFNILFYQTVMNKIWRSSCVHTRENVLEKESLFNEIKLLDKGFTSIFYENNGSYIGGKYLKDYISFFPADVPLYSDTIDFSDDDSMLESAAFKMLSFYNESMPFIKEKRVYGFVKKRDESRFSVKLQWNLIQRSKLSYLLEDYQRIVISSDDDELLELYNVLSTIRPVEILNEDNFYDVLNGKVDLIISKIGIWENVPTEWIHLKHLYINAYCLELKDFFDKNNINYLYYCIPDANRIVNHRKRVALESKQHVNNIIDDGGTYTVADGEINGCNYYHGRRRTTDVPMLWDKTIYFYGPCISIGVFALDYQTIESCLQRKMNSAEVPYRCVNIPAPLLLNPYDSAINTLHKIGKGKYREGDVVIHFGRNNLEWFGLSKTNIDRHDLSLVFNMPNNLQCKCFIGHMAAHVNSSGYKMVADYIWEEIKNIPPSKNIKSKYYQFHSETLEQQRPELNRYIKYLNENKFNVVDNEIIGSVAVNANPFTLGHAYLIDEARKRADYLYVFVAEEDLSDFSFETRYELVQKYCKQYDNVRVFPSGKFFASTLTFGDYFNRDALKEVLIDATLDCNIFSKIIAKELRINFRMLGEEKQDDITRQYNDYVKEILTKNGIEVIIIPRLEVNGGAVSAKSVREHIRKKEYDLLKNEVPVPTYEFIIKNDI